MNIKKKVDLVLEKSLIFIMALMVINVLWQIFTRYFTGNPSFFTDELARYLLIWLGVLGAAYVSGRNMHVAIDVFPSRTNSKTQKKLITLVNILIILFALAALVIGGIRLIYISYILKQHSPALNVPLWIIYAVLPVSGLFIIFYKTFDILKK